MPKFRQAMETSHSDSLSLLPASTIKVSRPLKKNQLIKTLERKENKLFPFLLPYYLFTRTTVCGEGDLCNTVPSRNLLRTGFDKGETDAAEHTSGYRSPFFPCV